jgi:pimeloyl-ACP methyl ester carboxylesterase
MRILSPINAGGGSAFGHCGVGACSGAIALTAISPPRIRVGDIDVAYRIAGRGRPVVLVHGLACGQRMWFHQRRKLSDRHTVITYDLRGHGHSDAPEEATRYSGAHLARDLLGLIDALGLDRIAVVGFSMGGGPALALAAARPDRVSHLVLADVGAGADDAWRTQWLARRWVDFADRNGFDDLVPDMLRSEFYKLYVNARPRFRQHMAGLIRRTPLTGLRHTLAEVLGKRTPLFRVRSALRAIKVPTLVMLGQHDYVCRNAARLMAETIPGAVLHKIAGAGHMSPLERPHEFGETLMAFFAG